MWCAISHTRIIGPFFFERLINAEAYQEIILDFISQLHEDESEIYFQQDGARAHTAQSTINFLGSFFGKRLISLNSVSGVIWPRRRPNLSPPEFFLWSDRKNRIYTTALASIADLKARIIAELATIGPELLKNVFSNLMRRACPCKDVNGQQFQPLF